MLLISNNQKNSNTSSFNENEVLRLIGNEQYIEAYTLLKYKSDKNICDTYNLALCCFMTQLYEDCLQYVSEISLVDLKKISMISTVNMDDIQQKMDDFQAQYLSCFTKGISVNYCNTFPKLLSDSMLRLKINCFVALKQWDNIAKNLNFNIGYKYKDINNAIRLAKENKTQN